MKRQMMTAVCLMLGIATTTLAQTDTTAAKNNETKTLFSIVKPSLTHVGAYLGSDYQYATIAGTNVWAQGGSGALLFNKKFAVGLAAYSTPRFTPILAGNTGLSMQYAMGGALLEYTIKPNSAFHISFPLLVGAGYARLDSSIYDDVRRGGGGRHDHNDTDNVARNYYAGTKSNFIVVQPGIRAELNVIKIAKIYAGASYRIATNSALTYPTATTAATVGNGALSGLSINAGVKIGLFDVSMTKKRHRLIRSNSRHRVGRHYGKRHHGNNKGGNDLDDAMPPPPPAQPQN